MRSPPLMPPAGRCGFCEVAYFAVSGVDKGLALGAVAGGGDPYPTATLAKVLLGRAEVFCDAILCDLRPAFSPLFGGGNDGGVFVGGAYLNRAKVWVGDLKGVGFCFAHFIASFRFLTV